MLSKSNNISIGYITALLISCYSLYRNLKLDGNNMNIFFDIACIVFLIFNCILEFVYKKKGKKVPKKLIIPSIIILICITIYTWMH